MHETGKIHRKTIGESRMKLRQKINLAVGLITSLILVWGGLFIHWFIFMFLIPPWSILIGGIIHKKYKEK